MVTWGRKTLGSRRYRKPGCLEQRGFFLFGLEHKGGAVFPQGLAAPPQAKLSGIRGLG